MQQTHRKKKKLVNFQMKKDFQQEKNTWLYPLGIYLIVKNGLYMTGTKRSEK